MTTPPPDKQPAAETLEEIALRVREIGRPIVTAWLERRTVNTLKHGDAVDLMERVGAAIEAEQVFPVKSQEAGNGDLLSRREVVERIEKQIRLWNNDTVTMACADMVADLKQAPSAANVADQEWALRDLADGFIGSNERAHFNHNARIVLNKVSEDVALSTRSACVEKVKDWLGKAGFDYGPLVREMESLTPFGSKK